MNAYYDYTTILRPGALQYPSNIQSESATGDLTAGAPLHQCYLNPGHSGTSETLAYDFKFRMSGTTGATYAVAWQYRSAGSTAWAAFASTSVTLSTSGQSVRMAGLSTLSMTCPVAIRVLVTATVSTAIAITVANYDVYDAYLAVRSQGHITV